MSRAAPYTGSPEFAKRLFEAMFGESDEEGDVSAQVGSAGNKAVGFVETAGKSVANLSGVQVRSRAPARPLAAEVSSREVALAKVLNGVPRELVPIPRKRPKGGEPKERFDFEEHRVLEFGIEESLTEAEREIEEAATVIPVAPLLIIWTLCFSPMQAISQAFDIIVKHCSCMSYVGICSSPVYRFMKPRTIRRQSTMKPHWPTWSRMFVIYCDVPRWAGWVEREIIDRFNLVFLPKQDDPSARRSLVNISAGGEGCSKDYIPHMFVYVLADNAMK